jgi:iron complex outermembrane receptor protein
MYGNYDIAALQKGATASVQWKPMNTLTFKVFGTIQDTRLMGNTSVKFDTLQRMGVIAFDPVNQTLTLSENIKITPTNYNTKSTPTFFGGFEMNYSPFEKINLNINGYYMTRQTFTGLSYEDFSGDREGNMENFDRNIVPNIILNSKITYNPRSKISVYLSARNVFGKHREFGFADNIGSLYMAGVSYNF